MNLKIFKRKPIFVVEGSEESDMFKYKNSFTLYAGDVIPFNVFTDLSKEELDNLCEGKYTGEQIVRFEMYGKFN